MADLSDLDELRADDISLGANPDLNVAVAQLLTLTENVTQPIQTLDITISLLRARAYSKLVVLAADVDPQSPGRMLSDLAIDALGLLSHVTTIYADAQGEADWTEIMLAMGGFVQAGVMGQDVLAGLTAKRTLTQQKWAGLSAGNLQNARAQP